MTGRRKPRMQLVRHEAGDGWAVPGVASIHPTRHGQTRVWDVRGTRGALVFEDYMVPRLAWARFARLIGVRPEA